MIGHEPSLSETNLRGWVALCECGWQSGVVGLPGAVGPRTASRQRRRELARGIALDLHTVHTHEVATDVARHSERALHDHARRIDLANATLQRRGRHGHS